MRRILIDENLPAGLAEKLGPVCEHVTGLGPQPSDDVIWNHAVENGLVILTKDADFFDKLAIRGSPPQIVWVRTGNMRRHQLEELLCSLWLRIDVLLGRADLVEVHDGRLEAIKF